MNDYEEELKFKKEMRESEAHRLEMEEHLAEGIKHMASAFVAFAKFADKEVQNKRERLKKSDDDIKFLQDIVDKTSTGK